ncbi:ferric uptake regulator, Fur family [Spirochaeta thermophila DSM 6578]|uniref:Ferric uptake regulation protein n=1 Tax=Winmispira thermophila (strain ATCC 700085 / DSM 6578 / Z-1203) TaxID=869211 RepID=G0GDQ8_WINT7|nr:Fur family transcriptional regulator [Spirochaeta thermophila]AEJ62188.1 ferric uptake regulator, Fur family [Spirochaeta thermophila DSM 6578]
MNRTAEALRKKDAVAVLREHGIKVSHQRVLVLEYLLEHDTHPTVDTIYQDLLPHVPGLSKTTVYNTVRLFVEKGIAQELTIEGTEFRYDIADPSHAHFKCVRCGALYDLPLPQELSAALRVPPGFRLEESHLYLKGVCPSCTRTN